MKAAFQRWWKRYRERRAAYRRVARHLRQRADSPAGYAGSFGRARAGRFEAKQRRRLYTRRALAIAGTVFALWLLWQSWIGLRIFAN